MNDEKRKLEEQIEYAKYEHETEMLRERELRISEWMRWITLPYWMLYSRFIPYIYFVSYGKEFGEAGEYSWCDVILFLFKYAFSLHIAPPTFTCSFTLYLLSSHSVNKLIWQITQFTPTSVLEGPHSLISTVYQECFHCSLLPHPSPQLSPLFFLFLITTL